MRNLLRFEHAQSPLKKINLYTIYKLTNIFLMFCCSNSVPSKYSPVETNEVEAPKNYHSTVFPGLRRNHHHEDRDAKFIVPEKFSATRGNALKEYVEKSRVSKLLEVTVPHNSSSGQILHVKTPDSDNQIIEVKIPPGLFPGSVFHVRYEDTPKLQDNSKKFNQAEILSTNHCEADSKNDRSSSILKPSSNESTPGSYYYDVASAPSSLRTHYSTHEQEYTNKRQASIELPPQSSIESTNQYQSSLILVKVPSGVSPGSTILVEIPGSDGRRQVEAVVPSGVNEFYIAYNPYDADKKTCNEKLIHVKVPEGVTPGTMISVQVRGEDKNIQAIVPHGVTEFYVSYKS